MGEAGFIHRGVSIVAQQNSNRPQRRRVGTAQRVQPRQRRVETPRTRKTEPVGRNRIVLAVTAVIVVALVGFMGASALMHPSTQESASNSAATPNGQANTSQSQADLSWRDADFAVDPNRETDWNYGSNGRKVVYLTIDDGPSENTQAVLDILDKYGCKATFFVVGHNPDYYPMIKEAYDRGHTIGLHTFTHDYATVYSSQQAYFDDLDAIGNVVKEQIGYVPCFIRFPGGSSNGISAEYSAGIMTALVDEVQARGYQFYDWNVSSGDGSDHTAGDLVYFATEEATEYENIVLLMHDSATKQSSVEALPSIIEYYQARGYTFEAIDRSTIVPHHGTNN